MARKSSVSSQPEKLVRKSTARTVGKPLTAKEQLELAALKGLPDSAIDFSDIPELTKHQIASFERSVKKLVAVRLDGDVFQWLQTFGPGYSTRINALLRAYMERSGR